MESIVETVFRVAMGLVLLGASIFVHEWGHYKVALLRGMKVEGFSIGFGPKVFGWTDSKGVEWALRWIPFGGFVKLPQMLTSEALEGGKREDAETQTSGNGGVATPWSRILVSVAGPAMNVVFAFFLAGIIWLVGLPTLINPPVVGYVEAGSAEASAGVKEGDRITHIEGRLINSWEDVMKVTALATTNILAIDFLRDGERYSASLLAEPNPVIGLKVLNLAPQDHPLVADVMAGSAAESAGLIKGDKFVSFGGVPVVGQAQLISLIQKRAAITTPMEVERNGERLRVDVTPILDPEAGVGRIGVIITGSTIATYKLQRPGPTPIEQFSIHLALLRDTLKALSQPKKSGVSPKDMAGPIGIAGMLAGEIGVDIRRALNLLVFLNLNLAILNLLPLPVLDGGHILMALFEMITRRKVSVRIQEAVTTAFALLLISFMLFVTFNDFKRIPLLRSHIRQNSVVEGESTTNPNLEPNATNPTTPEASAVQSPPPPTLSPVEVR